MKTLVINVSQIVLFTITLSSYAQMPHSDELVKIHSITTVEKNDILRYARSSNCSGIRHGDQNGSSLRKIEGAFRAITADGFTINVNLKMV